jgi:hypothetical protein
VSFVSACSSGVRIVLRTVGWCSGQDERLQRRLVVGQLRAGGRTAPGERSDNAILKVGQPTSNVPVYERLTAVALHLADQASTERRGQGCADRCLYGWDVLAREDEQCAAHRHPPHQAARVVALAP